MTKQAEAPEQGNELDMVALITDTVNRLAKKEGYQITFSESQIKLVWKAILIINKALNNETNNV